MDSGEYVRKPQSLARFDLRVRQVSAIVFLILFGPTLADASEEPTMKDCGYTTDGYELRLSAWRDAMAEDPFREGYFAYLTLFDRLLDEYRDWSTAAANWLPQCRNARGKTAVAAVERKMEELNIVFFELKARTVRLMTAAERLLSDDGVEASLWMTARALSQGDRTDCEALASIASRLARRVESPALFLRALERVLGTTSNPRYNPNRSFREALAVGFGHEVQHLPQVNFGDTGFKEQLRIRVRGVDNQVRHTVYYLRIGYEFTLPAARLQSYIADRMLGREPEDYELAVAAGRMGSELRWGDLDKIQMGQAIRTRLCAE